MELQPSNLSQKSSHPGPHLQSKNVCSTPKILVKDMDYHHRVLLKNSYHDWIIKNPERKPKVHTEYLDTGLEVNKISSILFRMSLVSVKHSEELSDIQVYRTFSKEPTPLSPSLCTPKIKSYHTLNKTLSQMVLSQ